MTTQTPAAHPVTIREISDLLAWWRRLTRTGGAPGRPGRPPACQADVLTRLTATEGPGRD